MTTTTEASKQLLSGSTNGRGIKVAATATAGTLLHTATSTSGQKDQVSLWAVNSSAASVKLTLEAGGVSAPDDQIEVSIPPESGLVEVLPGVSFNGGVVIRAFAASANVISIFGDVNRLTEA